MEHYEEEENIEQMNETLHTGCKGERYKAPENGYEHACIYKYPWTCEHCTKKKRS